MKRSCLLLGALLVLPHAPLFAELSSKAKKAEKLIAAGDVPGAVALYKELLAKNPAKEPALVQEGKEGLAACQVLQAKDALKSGNFAEAEKQLKETIAGFKDTAAFKDACAGLVQVRLSVGGQLYDAGKFDDCVAVTKETKTLVPAETAGLKDAASLIAKAQLGAAAKALQSKEYAKALSYLLAVPKGDLAKDDPLLAKSVEMAAKAGKDLLARAETQIQAGAYDAALKDIDLALMTGGADAFVAQAKYDTGLACRLNGQPDKALASYKEVLDAYKTTPSAPAAAYDIYLVQLARGNRPEALAGITAAAAMSPDNLEYLFARADLLKETGAADEAKKAYARLVDTLQDRLQKTFTGKDKLQYRLGLAYLGMDSYPEAAVELDKAVIRTPSFTEARKALALAQFKEANYTAAVQNYDLLLKQAGADYDAVQAVAAKSAELAPADAQKLEQMRAQIAFYHFQTGLCYEQLGNYDKAEQECRLGLEGVSTKDAVATMKRIQQEKAQAPVAAIPAQPSPVSHAPSPALSTSTTTTPVPAQ